jgi:FMN phosphatase YigB (HAD superfamily)
LISEQTLGQLEGLTFTRRPLVICDVDEVIVHFTRDFENYIAAEELWLDTASFALNGNIKCRRTGEAAPDHRVADLVNRFFDERTRHMQPIDGAVDSLLTFARTADVVLLTNLPHSAGDHRRANLAGHGLDFPVVTNSGPKGPAIREIVARAGKPDCVFIDDSPGFITSAYEHAPEIHLVHFLHDDRFARHIAPLEFVSLRTGSWDEARPHVLGLIGG